MTAEVETNATSASTGSTNAPATKTTATSGNAAGAPLAQYPMASLYVGDLHPGVTESQLYNKFAAIGPVLSIRVCRDAITRRSLGYAYVNFQQPGDAERAMDTMNFDVLLNKPIRIMWSQRDPTIRRAGNGNIFIKNLDPHIDPKSIYDTFSMFGSILSCKVATDVDDKSKGYGFIHFETEEAAQKAINKVNGMLLDNKVVYVGKFQPRAARLREMGEAAHRFTNVFIKNFADKLNDDQLLALFEKFGPICSHTVMKNDEGQSRGFGFVTFEQHEDAERAVNEMNNYEIEPGMKLAVCRAQKKAERDAELARAYEQVKAERLQRYQGVNLYVKNLDDTVTSDDLRRNFEQFGTVANTKVMLDEHGRSKGFGFVCFEKPEDATKAVVEMNNRMLANKPLYVALAQRKEERKAQLATQYMQRMASMRMQGPTGMPPVYAPAANPGYYMQQAMPNQRSPFVPTNSLPAQMRGGNAMGRFNQMGGGNFGVPNYMMQQPSQFGGQRPSRPPSAPRQQHQYQSGGHRGPQTRTSHGPIGAGQPMRALPHGKPHMPSTSGNAFYGQMNANMPQPRPLGQPPLMQDVSNDQEPLSTKLAAAPPQEQKQLLGEQLYPRISTLCKGDYVGKITGMMLEMDNSQLLTLVENPDELAERVHEAVKVLQQAKPQESAN